MRYRLLQWKLIVILVFGLMALEDCSLFRSPQRKAFSSSNVIISDENPRYLTKKIRKEQRQKEKSDYKAYKASKKRYDELQSKTARNNMKALQKQSRKINKPKKRKMFEKYYDKGCG
jgi:hypothetical protein